MCTRRESREMQRNQESGDHPTAKEQQMPSDRLHRLNEISLIYMHHQSRWPPRGQDQPWKKALDRGKVKNSVRTKTQLVQ